MGGLDVANAEAQVATTAAADPAARSIGAAVHLQPERPVRSGASGPVGGAHSGCGHSRRAALGPRRRPIRPAAPPSGYTSRPKQRSMGPPRESVSQRPTCFPDLRFPVRWASLASDFSSWLKWASRFWSFSPLASWPLSTWAASAPTSSCKRLSRRDRDHLSPDRAPSAAGGGKRLDCIGERRGHAEPCIEAVTATPKGRGPGHQALHSRRDQLFGCPGRSTVSVLFGRLPWYKARAPCQPTWLPSTRPSAAGGRIARKKAGTVGRD